MSTLRERFNELYDWAIVPDDAECYLEPWEFDMLMRWQETHTLEDGPRVLTVHKLPDTSEDSLMELQFFAYDRVSRIPTFDPPDDSEYAWAYDIFFYSAKEYIQFDAEMQLGEYQRMGRLDKRIDPPPYFFPNAEIRNEAMRGRCFVCVKPGHCTRWVQEYVCDLVGVPPESRNACAPRRPWHVRPRFRGTWTMEGCPVEVSCLRVRRDSAAISRPRRSIPLLCRTVPWVY